MKPAIDVTPEKRLPPALPEQPKKKRRMSRRTIAKRAALARWDSVREQKEEWLRPFYKMPIEEAMAYLENLRKVCSAAGEIMNTRLSQDKNNMRCAGPRCGKDLSGTLPNGRPRWIAKKDIRDSEHPEIIRSFYWCSEICHNEWVRKQGGWAGGDGR